MEQMKEESQIKEKQKHKEPRDVLVMEASFRARTQHPPRPAIHLALSR